MVPPCRSRHSKSAIWPHTETAVDRAARFLASCRALWLCVCSVLPLPLFPVPFHSGGRSATAMVVLLTACSSCASSASLASSAGSTTSVDALDAPASRRCLLDGSVCDRLRYEGSGMLRAARKDGSAIAPGRRRPRTFASGSASPLICGGSDGGCGANAGLVLVEAAAGGSGGSRGGSGGGGGGGGGIGDIGGIGGVG